MKRIALLLTLGYALGPGVAMSQELPRPSMVHSTDTHTLPTDYNFKTGPVLYNLNSSLETDYIDNIGLTNTGAKSDFLLTPEIGMTATWPVTEVNTLSLTTSLGYTKYLIHPQYDTSNVQVSPDSRLSFDIYTGNFKINVHDAFSFQQDPIGVGVLSNVVNFGRFQNTAGIGVLWDMNRLVLNLNYDHVNFLSTNIQTVNGNNLSNPGGLDYSADQVSASIESHFSSTFITGIEATASRRTYDSYSGNDDTFTIGPFLNIQATDHIKVQASGGYQYSDNSTNPISLGQLDNQPLAQQGMANGASDGYYADLTVDHELNRQWFQRVSVGHTINFDVFAQQSDVTYASYSTTWHVNSHLNIALTAGYQDVTENGLGQLAGSSYNSFNVGLQTSFPITKNISGSLFYDFTDKMASVSEQSYEQNRVGLILTCHF